MNFQVLKYGFEKEDGTTVGKMHEVYHEAVAIASRNGWRLIEYTFALSGTRELVHDYSKDNGEENGGEN